MANKQRFIPIALITCILLISIWLNAQAETWQQTPPLPSQGWRVCEDLGVGSVPGLGEDRQRFVLCNQPAGWEVLAYCLNPGAPPPEMGTYCSLSNETTFWCGNNVQQLELYGILQIPPTPTNTATATSTSTSTNTPTVPPATATVSPSQTQPPAPTQASTSQPTVVVRVAPGGPGNLRWIISAVTVFGSLLAGIFLLARKQAENK